jgi:hypothetical protein
VLAWSSPWSGWPLDALEHGEASLAAGPVAAAMMPLQFPMPWHQLLVAEEHLVECATIPIRQENIFFAQSWQQTQIFAQGHLSSTLALPEMPHHGLAILHLQSHIQRPNVQKDRLGICL